MSLGAQNYGSRCSCFSPLVSSAAEKDEYLLSSTAAQYGVLKHGY